MAQPSVEFHFDLGSPNAYLSNLVIPAIEARTGVAIRYVPVLLGAVFKAIGNCASSTKRSRVRRPRDESLRAIRPDRGIEEDLK